MMRRKWIMVIWVILGMQTPALAAKEMKWGFVDLRKAMQTVEMGKEANEKFNKESEVKLREFEKEKEKLKTAKEDLEKQQMVLSKEAFMRRQNEFTRQQMELQKKADTYQMELGNMQNEYLKEILSGMEDVLSEIGKKEGYDVIFERSSSQLLYADQSKDLTQQVIDAYNQRFKGKHLKTGKP